MGYGTGGTGWEGEAPAYSSLLPRESSRRMRRVSSPLAVRGEREGAARRARAISKDDRVMGWAVHQVVRRDEHADRRAHDIGVLPARGLAAASCVRAIRVRQRPHRRCLRLGRPRVLRERGRALSTTPSRWRGARPRAWGGSRCPRPQPTRTRPLQASGCRCAMARPRAGGEWRPTTSEGPMARTAIVMGAGSVAARAAALRISDPPPLRWSG